MSDLTIYRARSAEDIEQAGRLMQAYKEALGLEVFDNPGQRADEVLPGPYGKPGAGILLAARGDAPIGVVAWKSLNGGVCEMKRMFVSPEGRGSGAGRALAQDVMEAARADGYWRMVLDTLPRLEGAISLYSSLGFRPMPRYNDNPVPGVVFFAAEL